MKFKIPLFSQKFELDSFLENNPSPEQLEILNSIESKLELSTMQDVLRQMHEFYVEGQKHLEEMLPKMIEYGIITKEQFEKMKAESPSVETIEGFIDHLEEPFSINLPEPEDCKEGTFGLTMECSWDIEHGVGVWFENWKPTRVGFAEAGIP